jgi:Helix-turn-helix domain
MTARPWFLGVLHGEALRALRGTRSVAQVAASAGLSASQWRELEAGVCLPRTVSASATIANALGCDNRTIEGVMARILRRRYPIDEKARGRRGRSSATTAEVVAERLGTTARRAERLVADYIAESGGLAPETPDGLLALVIYYFRVWEPRERDQRSRQRRQEAPAQDVPGTLAWAARELGDIRQRLAKLGQSQAARTRSVVLPVQTLPSEEVRLSKPLLLEVTPGGQVGYQCEMPELGISFTAKTEKTAVINAGREIVALYDRLVTAPIRRRDREIWQRLRQVVEPVAGVGQAQSPTGDRGPMNTTFGGNYKDPA